MYNICFKPGHITDGCSDTAGPVLHCHGHCTTLMHKLLDACTREPMQPMLAKKTGVLRYNNDKQK